MNNHAHHDDRDYLICRYLDGDMSQAEAAAFQRQATEDAQLRADIDRYRRLDTELGELGGEVHVDYAAQRDAIMDSLQRRRRRQPSRGERWILRPILAACAAAAMFMLALGGYWLMVGTPDGGQGGGIGGSQPIAAESHTQPIAEMAIVTPAHRQTGVVRTTLRRKGMLEELQHRMRTLGDGSVVVSVGSSLTAEQRHDAESAAMGLWLN